MSGPSWSSTPGTFTLGLDGHLDFLSPPNESGTYAFTFKLFDGTVDVDPWIQTRDANGSLLDRRRGSGTPSAVTHSCRKHTVDPSSTLHAGGILVG
ncbi:MAG: hypothetical protein HY791_05810 [Deltaproteobacteria bacterium]|nr:hypothetical protein [Deltaproteobacteria bacterium]